MPVAIIEKEKTQPKSPYNHDCLVPLRVAKILNLPGNYKQEEFDKRIQVDDIVVLMPGAHADFIFNATKNSILPTEWREVFLVVRAYHIKQIVICNDNEPAPVL